MLIKNSPSGSVHLGGWRTSTAEDCEGDGPSDSQANRAVTDYCHAIRQVHPDGGYRTTTSRPAFHIELPLASSSREQHPHQGSSNSGIHHHGQKRRLLFTNPRWWSGVTLWGHSEKWRRRRVDLDGARRATPTETLTPTRTIQVRRHFSGLATSLVSIPF